MRDRQRQRIAIVKAVTDAKQAAHFEPAAQRVAVLTLEIDAGQDAGLDEPVSVQGIFSGNARAQVEITIGMQCRRSGQPGAEATPLPERRVLVFQ